jgi:hypothetical protein
MLGSRLQAIDADCERAAKIELAQLFENVRGSENNFRLPSPQAAEAIWLKLIARKEHEFIQEIDKTLKEKLAAQSSGKNAIADNEDIAGIEALVAELLADERYVDRMRNFYQEAALRATSPGTGGQASQAGFIDATYRTGITAALRKARRSVFAELEPHKPVAANEDNSFSSQWNRYSTLSPWRLIWTIIMLSLTSYLIAFVISSDAFRGFLERFGWPGGSGL